MLGVMSLIFQRKGKGSHNNKVNHLACTLTQFLSTQLNGLSQAVGNLPINLAEEKQVVQDIYLSILRVVQNYYLKHGIRLDIIQRKGRMQIFIQ